MGRKISVLVLALCLLLTACVKIEITFPENDKDDSTSGNSTEASVEIKDYPDAIASEEEKLLMPLLPDEIFETTAEENNLGGTLYKIYGTVVAITEGPDGIADTIRLNTLEGDVVISNIVFAMEAESTSGELGFTDWEKVKASCPMPEVGESCRVFAEYQGYSEKEQAPHFIYGSSDFLTEIVIASTTIE